MVAGTDRTLRHENFGEPDHEMERETDTQGSYFASEEEVGGKRKKKEGQHHRVFPCGHPSQYWPSPAALDFRDQTRTGTFAAV